MRLIDADGIKNSLLTELLMGVDGGTDASYLKTYEVIDSIENIVNEWVDNQPTVNAIPIEWLHSIMEKQLIFAMESEMEGTITVQDGVIHCVSGALACQVLANTIKLWVKENETD